MEDPEFDKSLLVKVLETPMPFGKYQGRLLIDLPEPYLLWFEKQGFPKGEIGKLLALSLEISVSGSRNLVKSVKNA